MIGKYIKGMLEITVCGVNLERFINKCNASGIPLYSVCREKYDLMRCVIDLKSFKKISAINRELKCRIRVKRRYGLKFLFNRIMRRKMFVVGAAVFIVFMTVLSSSVWRIDITGIDRIRATDILSVVNGMDAGVGIFKAKCDTKALEMAIRAELDDVDWVIVKIDGTVMKINVIETVIGRPREDKSPASIVSEVAGEVVYVSAMRGDKMVKPGDMISPGQTLINGIIDDRNLGVVYVRNAMGTVRARVEYTGEARLDINDVDNRVFTGNVTEKRCIKIFGLTIGQKDASPYENSTKEVTEHSVFKEHSLFPIYAVKTTYREYTVMSDEEQKAKAGELLMREAINDARRLIPLNADIETQEIEYDIDAETGMIYAKSTVTAVHEIGIKKYLTQSEIDEVLNNGGKDSNG